MGPSGIRIPRVMLKSKWSSFAIKVEEGYLLAISVGTWNCVKRERLGTCLEETR